MNRDDEQLAAALAAADQQYSLVKRTLEKAVVDAANLLATNDETSTWALLGTKIVRQLDLDGRYRQFAGEMLAAAAIQIAKAIEVADRYGQIDEAHHKAWVIDQMVRTLAGDRYERIVAEHKAGEDGPDTYTWDEGIIP